MLDLFFTKNGRALRADMEQAAYLIVDTVYKRCTLFDYYTMPRTLIDARLSRFSAKDKVDIMRLVQLDLSNRGVNTMLTPKNCIFARVVKYV